MTTVEAPPRLPGTTDAPGGPPGAEGTVVRGRAQRLVDAVCGGGVSLLVLPVLLPLFAGGGTGWLVAAGALPVAVAAVTVAVGGEASTGAGASPASVNPALTGPWARLVADVVAVLILLALLPADPAGRGALAGLVSGAARLVTAALPAVPAGPELGAVTVALALAAGIGAELGIRARSALAPALPAVVLFVAAIAVGTGGLAAPSWGAVLLLAGVAVTGLIRRQAPLAAGEGATRRGPAVAGAREQRPPVPWRQLAAGAALAVLVAALAVPLGDLLPGSSPASRYDLRNALRPAVPPPPGLNPLVTYAATYDGPPEPVMAVRVTGADPTSLYWRLDVLDHFTGTGWTSTTPLLPAGTTLPPGPAQPGRTTSVTADVQLQRPTVYLPAPDRPTSVSAAGLRVAPATGVLAISPGQIPPASYRVRLAVAAPTAQQLLAASTVPVDDPGGAAPSGAISSAAFPLIQHVEPTAFARLTAIQDYLTGPGFTHHPPGDSPIGSGNYQVEQLLSQRDGSAEQYAAAFALLARADGYAARLAVGYRGGTIDPATGEVSYTTRDLTVWPEVYLTGIGWQPFPAVPSSGARSPNHPAPAPSSALNQALQQQSSANAAGAPPPTPGRPLPPSHRPAAGGGNGLLWVLVPVAVVAAALAGVVALVAVKVARRRRQQRRADPGERVDGAWECVLDRLAEHGVALAASLTVPEVAERAAATCGPDRVGPLAQLVGVVDARRYNRLVAQSPTAADLAWSRTEEVERALRHGLPVRRRLRVLLSPAPFLRP